MFKKKWQWGIAPLVLIVVVLVIKTIAPPVPSFRFPWQGASTSAPASAAVATTNIVATGPRCDNVPRTIQVNGYQPGHPGCTSDWMISDSSPEDCLMLVGPHTSHMVCKGHEGDFNGMPIIGWRTVPNATTATLIDVTFHS